MNELQIQASDPSYSIWVAASAGTGKTKILTDRVLRLLLGGAHFDKILCLTFTNAAALEMQTRILDKLAYWANVSIELLIVELHLLLQKTPSKEDLNNARNLYHKLLSAQDKINIHTIHSFCQRILKQFPLEAGVSPAFQVIGNIEEQEILRKVKNQLYLRNEEHQVIDFFVANFHETIIEDLLAEIKEHSIKFKSSEYLESAVEPARPTLIFNLPNILVEIGLAKQAHLIINYLTTHLSANLDWECVKEFCLTKQGTIRKKLSINQDKETAQLLTEHLMVLQQKIYQLDQDYKLAQVTYQSIKLKNLAKLFIKLYEDYKMQYSLLDYDDLIFFAKTLLTQREAKEWVLYKLDGGIDHLLVDEAQDTSPQQWSIIEAIIAEFYVGETAREQDRTIFVVGDEKQSIFSFQGADIQSFHLMNDHLKQKLKAVDKNFKEINLEWSYRSCKEILDVTHGVFDYIKNLDNSLFTAVNPKILSFRDTHPGRVELWPLITNQKNASNFWPLPDKQSESQAASIKLASNIADFIQQKISKKIILPSTGKKARAGDFMILFRRRNQFTLEVINQLQQRGLEVAGIDRLMLNQNLSVADLIACAKFVLLPDDDLNLAALLRSPIVHFSEYDLQNLSAKRQNNQSLWQIMQFQSLMYQEILAKLNKLLQLYKIANTANFFHIIVDCLELRSKINAANGPESDDSINELIYLYKDYVSKKDHSLQGFVHWFENNEIEIKRDTSCCASKIKIMTVHGAKGLQAPIVILCDTTSLPISKNKFMWNEEGAFFFTNAANIPDSLLPIKLKQQQQDLQEYLRLLYVAMTRAEDQLILCGFADDEKIPDNCWYNLVQKSMKKLNCSVADDLLIYEHHAKNLSLSAEVCSSEDEAPNFAEINDLEIDYKIPELSLDFTIDSPLIAQDYLEYGKIFHKILEDCLNLKNISPMNAHPLVGTLSPKWQNKIYQSISKLQASQQFQDIVAMDIKTEINIGLLGKAGIDTGRIDLLAIDDDKIIIIDYKSDSKPIYKVEEIPEYYVCQLNFYRQTIQKIYPQHQISCQILWLQSAEFTEIYAN